MKKTPFTDEQLTYAAHSRCECGAGLAYPNNPTMRQMKEWENENSPFAMWSFWDCSDILTGRAIPKGQEGSKMHTGRLPFAFYEIKSETQPSAYGATTRNSKI
jgi:hypothetical protein